VTSRISTAEPDATNSDDQLALLLERLLEARRRGEEPDIAAEARLHPEFASELQSLWTAAMLADELGPQSVELDGIRTLETQIGSSPQPAAALPRRFGDYDC
jgi:hypothetical protein